MHHLVIRAGTVVDGTGQAPFTADIAINNDTITEIGKNIGPARQELDADGLLVTPGFVDMHTHYDSQVSRDPDMTPSVWPGVATVVMGNCGVGFAPVRPGSALPSPTPDPIWAASRSTASPMVAELAAPPIHTFNRLEKLFPLGETPDYEPSPEASVAAGAARRGVDPHKAP